MRRRAIGPGRVTVVTRSATRPYERVTRRIASLLPLPVVT